MFITLSFSDICVSLLSVPMISLTLFTQNLDVLCMSFSIMKFFLYLPYGFSWFMIIIITIDRVLLITKGHIYKTHITMKVIYSITVFSILLNLAVATLVTMEAKFSKEFPLWLTYCQVAAEISFTIITVVAYIYLFWFVRSKSKVIANARYGRTNFDTKFVMNVTYIYTCLLLFTLPYLAIGAVRYNVLISDPVLERNLRYWGFIILCSNSYANAWIILYKSRKTGNTMK